MNALQELGLRTVTLVAHLGRVAAFVTANPDIPAHRVHYAVYFLHGALIQILSQGRAFERLLDSGESVSDADELVVELAAFFAHGLEGAGRR